MVDPLSFADVRILIENDFQEGIKSLRLSDTPSVRLGFYRAWYETVENEPHPNEEIHLLILDHLRNEIDTCVKRINAEVSN